MTKIPPLNPPSLVRVLISFAFSAIAVLLALGVAWSASSLASLTRAATLIVTTTADSGAGSLRDTIAAASGGDTIQFDPTLNGQTINLTSGELVIDKNITISGPGSNLLTVSRSSTPATFRIFHVTPSRTVTIAGLTIQNGSGIGGGVLNDHATLTIDSCIVSGNFAPDSQGAGLYNNGSGSNAHLTILNSTISGNQALSTLTLTAGGGIANDGSNGGSPTLTIVNSLVNDNLAKFDQGFASSGNGGGIYNNGASATLAITNSSVNNNGAGRPPGGSGPTFGHGGGIWNSGLATITGSTVNGNVAGFGGGSTNSGTLTITGGSVNNNTAAGAVVHSQWGDGGGIDNGGTLTITNTTLSGNFALQFGGALNGNGVITNCTITSNQAVIGGGINGSPTVANSTISENNAFSFGYGGGISGSPTVTNSTISGNSAGSGGGIYGGGVIRHCTIAGNTGGAISVTGSLEIGNTILKTGTAGANILDSGGTVTSHGYNVSNDNGEGFLTGPGDQINTDPMLGPLQNNGGSTFTHELLTGSPAINAGDPNFTPPPLYDQRGPGYDRVFNGRIDIGSLEVQPSFISGAISYCSNPALNPVPGVTMTLTGATSAVTTTDANGNYTFPGLASGGSYTVTPTMTALAPGSSGINTSDVIAAQRHFLNIVLLPPGCRRDAADVNGDTVINTGDVLAIQRFALGHTTGIANVGTYRFNPLSRSYPPLTISQTNQNYDTLVYGDISAGFVHRHEGGPSQDGIDDSAGEVPYTAAAIVLPEIAGAQSKSNLIAAVSTTTINASDKLVGFQGDLTFDERVVTFQKPPVQRAGLTGGNWNVSGNVLPGNGPIRTLRISAFSLDFAPLSGSGTLFELRMLRTSQAKSTPLLWAAGEDQFIFIDAGLNTQKPVL